MAKKPPKTPAWKQNKPTNPYNNAGGKNPASSRGPTNWSEVRTARDKAIIKTARTNKPASFNTAARNSSNVAKAMTRPGSNLTSGGVEKGAGMIRKNIIKKAEVGLKRMTSPTNPMVSKGTNAYTKYNSRMSALKNTALKGTSTASKAVSVGSKLARGAGVAGALIGAAQAGYAVGTALNNKFNISSKIVDHFAPKYDPNAKGRSRTLTKNGSYDSPALKSHLASKKKKGR